MCLSQQIPLPVVPNPQLLRTGVLLPVPVGLPRVHLLRAAESGGPADRMQGDLALLRLLLSPPHQGHNALTPVLASACTSVCPNLCVCVWREISKRRGTTFGGGVGVIGQVRMKGFLLV